LRICLGPKSFLTAVVTSRPRLLTLVFFPRFPKRKKDVYRYLLGPVLFRVYRKQLILKSFLCWLHMIILYVEDKCDLCGGCQLSDFSKVNKSQEQA
jgi:hypothetical protein